MRSIAVLFVSLLLWTALGCAGGQGDTSQGQSSPQNDEGSRQAQETPAVINLSGNGATATDPFDLESGLAIFRMSYQGERNFIAQLLGETGMQMGENLLANEIGSFEGSQAVQTKAGRHVLDVQASGPRTITIEQPRPTGAPSTGSYTYQTGKTTTDFFYLSKGLKTFAMSHQGEENFIVWLLDRSARAARAAPRLKRMAS